MDFILAIFNETLYRPLFNLLVFIYNVIPGQDFGVAIIVVTVLLRLALFPLAHKALKSQKALQEFQPKIKELQKNIKDKEERAKALMQFYKDNNINPFSGCLPLLIQLPILIGLYRVFLTGLNPESLEALYPFISNPGTINSSFIGLIDLANPHYGLAILAGFSQFIQSKLTFQKKSAPETGAESDFTKSMTMSFTYVMPVILVIISWNLPAGLPLYWVVSMLFSIGQQVIVNKSFSSPSGQTGSVDINSAGTKTKS